MMIDEERSAAGASPRFDVPPSVADQETGGEVDVEFAGGAHEKPGFRFPAVALITVIVEARQNGVQIQFAQEMFVNAVDRMARRHPPGHIGLVGDDHKAVAQGSQGRQGLRHARQKGQIAQ